MSLWYEWASPIPYLFDLLSETSSFTNMAVVVRLKTNRFFSFFRFQHPKPKVNKASSGLRSKQISTEARHEEHVSRSHLQLSRKTHRVEMLRLSLHSVSRFFILRTYIKALFPPLKPRWLFGASIIDQHFDLTEKRVIDFSRSAFGPAAASYE